MRHVGELLTDGDVSWLPDRDFSKAIAQLKDRNFGTLAAADDAEIDVSKLHRSTKLKSGFVGVYANGNGFRAMSRDAMGKTVAIGTFKTAEEAAHRRLLYARANNLAYGELETEMEAWRANPVRWNINGNISDEQLIAAIKDHCRSAQTWDYIFGPDCVTIEPTFSRRLPKREEALARLSSVKPKQLGPGAVDEALASLPGATVAYMTPEQPALDAPGEIGDGPQCEAKGQCEDIDGSGACYGCGRWLGDEKKASTTGETPIGLDPNDLPESWG